MVVGLEAGLGIYLDCLRARPRSKGLSTDDLDHDVAEDPDYQQSALQIACSSRKSEILHQLKPDPASDDLRELMAAAGRWTTTPETVAYLVRLGADVNDRADGGSTVPSRRRVNTRGRRELSRLPSARPCGIPPATTADSCTTRSGRSRPRRSRTGMV